MRNMYLLDGQPEELQEEFFDELFAVTRVESLRADDKEIYIKSMTTERDIKNQIAFAREEGLAEGLAEGEARGKTDGILQTAKNLLVAGVSIDIISKCTGLSEEAVLTLGKSK